VLEGAHATVYLVSTLAGLVDPKFGRDLMVVGDSALQVFEAAERYGDTITRLGELAKLGAATNLATGMAGAALTGNIVGALMNIVSLFQEAGPTPEQIILDQIGRLGRQVSRLHEQMHERFDRVEQQLDAIHGGLNAIFELLTTRFDQITADVAAVQRDADQIQRQLARQELLLTRLGQSVHKGLQDGFRHDFRTALNSALGYRERNGVDMSLEEFSRWEGELYTWAVDEAHNENEQPVAGRGYTDDLVLGELTSHPVEENVGYLSNWLRRRAALPELVDAPVPNPVTWSICAWAYAQLLGENPGLARSAAYADRRAAVERQGERVRAALRRITVRQDLAEGPQPNHELFEWLFAHYGNTVDAFDEAIARLEAAEPKTLPKADPWGGPRQAIDAPPVLGPDAPSTLAQFIPSPYLLADYLTPEDPGLSVVFEPQWTAPKFEKRQGRVQSWAVTTATLQVTVAVVYRGARVLARRVVGDRMDMRVVTIDNRTGEITDTWDLEPKAALDEHWTSGQKLKRRFEAGSVETSPAVVVDDALDRAARGLRMLRAEVYGKIAFELEPGQSLQLYARRLDGAKALIDSFITLGMPDALAADDFLRAMLYGTQSLVDSRQIQERYASAYADALPDGGNRQGSTNPRLAIRSAAKERSSALGASLARYRELIGEQKHTETFAVIDTALSKSEAVAVYLRLVDKHADTAPPVGTVSINDGAAYTRRRSVALSLTASDPRPGSGVAQMRLSNDRTTWSEWEPFAATRSWVLSSGDGRKTVYVEFKDKAGLVSPVARDSVVLDTSAPLIAAFKPAAGSSVRTRRPSIGSTVKDARTDLTASSIRLSIDGKAISSFSYDTATDKLAYRPGRKLALGTHTVKITANDLAGNVRSKQWKFKVVA
jgi:hypothetical protein